MALPIDVTDPGTQQQPLINVGDQAFGTGVPVQVPPVGSTPSSVGAVDADGDASGQTRPNQENGNQGIIRSSPSSNSGPVVQGVAFKPGIGVGTNNDNPDLVDVEDQPRAGLGLPAQVSGDASRPGVTATETTQNNVAGQVYGSANGRGLPTNVFV